MRKKITGAIPFLVTVVLLFYCWIIVILTDYAAEPRHYVALVLVLANGLLYLKKYKWAVLFTGVILLLAAFNLVTFYAATQTFGFSIAGVQLAEIQYWSLLLLAIYGVINYNLLVDWCLDYKESKHK